MTRPAFPYEDENVSDASVVIAEAQVRTRIKHEKVGGSWRFESTVEVTGADNPEAHERLHVEYERLTDQIGRDGCALRTASDEVEQVFRQRRAS